VKETKSTCCYCGVGCGVVIQSEGERIIGVRGDSDHPANFGRLCTKGATPHLCAQPTGVDPLRDLYDAKRAREAHECIYIAADEITDGARAFALEKNIRLIHGAELAKLLPRVRRT